VKEGRAYLRSAAVLEIARGLPRWAVLARIFSLVPASLRDRIYDFIARNRHRWFGRPGVCVLPEPAKPRDKTPAPGP
jgi:predicted DCC family thiol-disulfide oxidoreductase YuxK